MPEGLLGGILNEEEESGLSTKAGTEAFAAAIATDIASQNPQLAAETAAFLRKQTELVEAQRKSVEAEHKYFEREWRPRLFGMRLRAAFQVFFALVATVIGLGGAMMIRDAVTSRRVIVDPFHAPPPLAARGIDGVVVASGLLDELSRLQDATRSSVQKLDQSNGWSSQVTLEVPETGISVGEISRLLKERYGHDVHIEGDLVETASGGLALTVRGNSVAARTFDGSVTELDKLTTRAAEYVYSKSQPARWASYLLNVGRNDEAIAFCRTAFGGVRSEDRPYLLNAWANGIQNTGGSVEESLNLYRAALKLKPDYWVGHNNVMNALWLLGQEEAAWQAGEAMRDIAGGRPGRAPDLMYQNWDTLTWNLGPWMQSVLADADANGGAGTGVSTAGLGIADFLARMHDPEGSELALKTTKEDPNDPTIGAMTHFVRGRLAYEAGRVSAAASEMEAFAAAYANPVVASNYPGFDCWIAPVEEAAGHPEKADALLNSAGTYVDCYRFRADILDGRGNWPAAQKAYAEAVALAPDLPAGYYSWGVALATHGDLAGAAAKLQLANQKGPHWADPLKAWGDVLVKQGHTKEAFIKYDDALKYAPNWKQLKEAREAVAKLKT
jgi:tetratricopeptide (TPR) repeat protein